MNVRRTLPLVLLAAVPLAAQGATYRVSLSALHGQANDRSIEPSLSRDGLLVAFTSFATDLVPGDGNGMPDVFVKDLITGAVQRVSISTAGTEANGPSRAPRISADGRFVCYESDATNLVTGDTNGYTDVFLFERATARTTRVSIAGNGMQADLPSSFPSISGDGRHVAFVSMATNLVAGDTNNYLDVFVHDRLLRQTVRASVSTQNAQGNDDCFAPSISGDGRWVAFSSGASNLVAGDANGLQDVFLRDLQLASTTRVSVGTGGAEANGDSLSPSLGAGGRYVAFHSAASNLVAGDANGRIDVFRVDRNTGAVQRCSIDDAGAEGDADSTFAQIAEDGLRVAFTSEAANLAPANGAFPDVFVRDFATGRTSLHSQSSDGLSASEWTGAPSISGDGRYVAFPTLASNIVGNDTNQAEDVLVNETCHRLTASGPLRIGQTTTLSLSSPRDPGALAICLASFNTQFGTRLGGRLFPLDTDALLQACLGAPSMFGAFIGSLDAGGQRTAFVAMPNLPGLVGFEMDVGYVVLDPAFPTGFRGFANARFFQVGP